MAEETILVPAELPAVPLVLADAKFLVTLAGVERQIATLSVTSPESAQEAANLLRRLTEAGNGIEKTRTALKKPFINIGRKIDDVAKLVGQRIEASKDALRKELSDWNTAEQARLAEIERQRQAELRRLEEEKRRQEEAEAARVAALAATTPPADALDFDFEAPPAAPKTEVEKQIEAIKYAPAPVAQKPAGVRFSKVLRFAVNDLSQLPEQFVTKAANETLIRSTYCWGWKEDMPLPSVPGLVFWADTQTASTGRATQ